MIYTLTCNPAIDYVACLDGPLASGKINRNSREEFQFGGKGVNVSNMLRTLGLESVALGFVAGFTGRALEEGLGAMGLRTRFISVERGMTRINVKIKAGLETEVNGLGPEISPAEWARLLAQLEEVKPGDVLVLSGSVPKCLGPGAYGEIMAGLADREILTVVDAAGALLENTLEYHPFLIKPNLEELGALCGEVLTGDAQIAGAAARLQSRGARNVMVSLSGDGALLLDETGRIHRSPCPQGTVLNSVGAGDSMVAGFLAGWLATRDYDRALKLGIAAGSATAFSLGLGDGPLIGELLQML